MIGAVLGDEVQGKEQVISNDGGRSDWVIFFMRIRGG